MKTMIFIFPALFGYGVARSQTMASAIRLEKDGNAARLMIDRQPFLVLGGELGNSSASSVEYMKP
jgi:hypothetical protein